MNKGIYTVQSNVPLTQTGVWKMVLEFSDHSGVASCERYSSFPVGAGNQNHFAGIEMPDQVGHDGGVTVGHDGDVVVWHDGERRDAGAIGGWEETLRPGQFVNLSLLGHYLRRPISICDWDKEAGTITIVYRVVGEGTRDMSGYQVGTQVDMLTGLGNGFSTDAHQPLLVGGGVGLPPMLALAKSFISKGIKPTVIGGFASKADVILQKEFAEIGLKLEIATMDGSLGYKGTVIDAINALGLIPQIGSSSECTDSPSPQPTPSSDTTLSCAQPVASSECTDSPSPQPTSSSNTTLSCAQPMASSDPTTPPSAQHDEPDLISECRLPLDYIYACGPKPMLKALSELPLPAELSVEERMGCGYGICMGCTCQTTRGFKRVCKDGPVFKKEELLW